MSATIAQRLADYVVGLRFEDLPAEVVGAVKQHLGLALQAQRGELVAPALRVAGDLTSAAAARASSQRDRARRERRDGVDREQQQEQRDAELERLDVHELTAELVPEGAR